MVYAVYYSPTYTSKKGVISIAESLGEEIREIDLTQPKTEGKNFTEKDIIIFGAPVYGGRLYYKTAEKIRQFCGNNTPCIATVTYGNRHYDDALKEMCDILEEKGFIPFAAAALVGRHTYGEIQTDRPNEEDAAQNREFAVKCLEKLNNGTPETIEVPGNVPYKDGGKGGSFYPRTTEACAECGKCASKCPEEAIKMPGTVTDESRCISCFRCIRICPREARVMDTPQYIGFAEKFTQMLSKRRENEYFI